MSGEPNSSGGGDGRLTPERRELASKLDGLGGYTGSLEMAERIARASLERFEGHLHIAQLLVRKNLKQVEFAREVADAFLATRRGGRATRRGSRLA